MRITSLLGMSIAQYESPNGDGPMSDHRGVVLHIAQGSYKGTISWQMNPDQEYADGTNVNTCSTFVVGGLPGQWAQMKDTDDIAWCQRDGSRTWLSIELCDIYAPAPMTPWQLDACAALLAWSAEHYGHPIAVADNPSMRGLGHHSMDRESFGEEWGHDECPGAGVIGGKVEVVNRALAMVGGGEDEEMSRLTFFMADGKYWRSDAARSSIRAIRTGTDYRQVQDRGECFPDADANGFPTPDIIRDPDRGGWTWDQIQLAYGRLDEPIEEPEPEPGPDGLTVPDTRTLADLDGPDAPATLAEGANV